MTRIDFYILADSAQRSRALFVCRLAEKAYRMKHPIYIHTESEQQSALMDDLLWTFSQGSFLPHALAHQITAASAMHRDDLALAPPCTAAAPVRPALAALVPPCTAAAPVRPAPAALVPPCTADNIPAIVIGHSNELLPLIQPHITVLINMASDVPLFFSHFERVAEIIDQSPTQKQIGRERYRFYRDRGYDLQSHNIAASEI